MALWGWAAMKAQRVRNSRFQSPKGLRRGTVAAADEDPAAAEAAAPEAAAPAADPPALVPAAVRRERSTSTGIGISRGGSGSNDSAHRGRSSASLFSL